MIINTNEQNILNFISDFHIATSGQIYRLFFPGKYRYCMKRLKTMQEEGFIKRTNSTIDNCFAYYTDKKPCQLHHDLIRAELFTALNQRYKVISWHNEEPVKNIRPDATALLNSAFTYINDHEIVFPVFIEIHLNNQFNFDKYKELLRTTNLREMYGGMPRVLICTDRELKLPILGIKFKIVGLDMSGIETLLK
jgi:hypothetical protein